MSTIASSAANTSLHDATAPTVQSTADVQPQSRPRGPVVVVSVSLGSSKRNDRAETTLLGVPVIMERIGVDGDRKKARALFEELDGRVHAFGFGGADLGITVAGRFYKFTSLEPLTSGLKTPVVDGGALRRVIERRCVQAFTPLMPDIQPKRVLITTAVDRYDMACSFADAGYKLRMGDLGFVLGLPIALRSLPALHLVARLLLPILRRLPFEQLYPTGKKQEEIHPRFPRWFAWATVIGGDFLFLRTHMPNRLDGKIVVTNTTTAADVEILRSRGARALITTTPRLNGRSFGTNVLEAALTAIANQGRPLRDDEIRAMLGAKGLPPSIIHFDGAA